MVHLPKKNPPKKKPPPQSLRAGGKTLWGDRLLWRERNEKEVWEKLLLKKVLVVDQGKSVMLPRRSASRCAKDGEMGGKGIAVIGVHVDCAGGERGDHDWHYGKGRKKESPRKGRRRSRAWTSALGIEEKRGTERRRWIERKGQKERVEQMWGRRE